ncbi:ATP-binding cassette domain-containing protein [Gracilibacillus salitolerans]|uniref:ATP-binding cassette domain-containing protein n=1 Tax=Gracilibacillus salitolerans TaxID=2663022 RepID=A0A5Q2TIJ1_9BACI|nr:ABC transporter ATP-binding protein [Gracilibacillus salitolerans]QGH33803.1 ATP-binding cassette domain-containing protein [Gracilibacillus salitolerans]
MTIAINQLSKEFDGFQALKKIDLQVREGEFIAILGPSGCGKTTLLRLLAGFLSPSEGEIVIGNETVGNLQQTLPPERRNIGMVFQSFALWPHLNVEEHIRFPLMHHRFVSDEIKRKQKDRMKEVLKMVNLESFADRMPTELSGGQKQRVALARAIAPQPDLLLMDEPLSNLDAELRMEMRGEIQALHQLTKATIVYVTHDQGEALAMADRIVVMNQGEIEQIGTPSEIYSKPESPFVARFVGKANLVEGNWNGKYFTPSLSPDIQWPDTGVVSEMKQRNIFPVRPEQFRLSEENQEETGLPGLITSVQFQGKEIHYTVQITNQTWTVHTDVSQQFSLGEQVYMHLSVPDNTENKHLNHQAI